MSRIQTIIFDLGKVIVDFDFERSIERLAACSSIPAVQVRNILKESGLGIRVETGAVSSAEFFEESCRILSLRCPYDEFCDIWNSIFFEEPLIPETMLAGLKRNYGMALLSNTNEIHFTSLRSRFDSHLRHFDTFILSHEVGAAKPDPRIYEAAVEKAGREPEECLFIDDMAENVAGARRAGLDSIQFTGLDQLQKDFETRSIRWQE